MKTQSFCTIILTIIFYTHSYSQWFQSSTGINQSQVCSFIATGEHLFAGTAGGIFRSTDSGTSWIEVDSGLTNFTTPRFAVDGTNLFVSGMVGGIFRSTNFGEQWIATPVFSESDGSLGPLAVSRNNLLVGTYNGVFVSTNKGTNWIQSSLDSLDVSCFAVGDSIVFAGTYLGIYLSTDNGVTWVPSGLTGWGIRIIDIALVSREAHGATLYAAYYSPGGRKVGPLSPLSRARIIMSNDYGKTWTASDSGLPSSQTNSYSFVVYGTNLFLGIYNGVYLSGSDGAIWQSVNLGLSDTNVSCLAISGTNLFAGTWSGGVWRRPLSEMITSVQQLSDGLPNRFALEQNYPNPFNPSTTIRFDIPIQSHVTLTIFDLLGREVTTLVNETLNAGSYNTIWNAEDNASGIYFYQVKAETYVNTKKMLLIK